MALETSGDATNVIQPGQEGQVDPMTSLNVNETTGADSTASVNEPQGSFSPDALKKVAEDTAAKDYKQQGSLPESTDIKIGEYDFAPILGEDNDIIRGERQGTGTKLATGVARLGATAVTKTVSGIGSMLSIPLALASGSIEPILNNSISALADSAGDAAKEALPIYKGNTYTNGDWLEQMSTLDFIMDDGMDALAFLASSYAQGYGLGIAAKAASGTKAFSAAMNAAKLGKFTKNLNMTKLANNMTTAGITALNSTAEAAVEARDTRHEVLEALKGDVAAGRLTQDEADIKAASAASENFWTNMAILGPSNMLETSMLFKPFIQGTDEAGKVVTGAADAVNKARKVAKNAKWKSAWDFSKAALKSAASEGLWEEAMQTASTNYSIDKATGETERGIVDGMVTNWIDGWSTDEGKQSMMLGAIIGLIPGGIGGMREGKAERASEIKRTLAQGAYVNSLKKNKPGDIYQTDKEGNVVLNEKGNPVYDTEKIQGQFMHSYATVYENFINAQIAQENGDKMLYDFATNRQFADTYFSQRMQGLSEEEISNHFEVTAKASVDQMLESGLIEGLSAEQYQEKVDELVNTYKDSMEGLDKVYRSVQDNYAGKIDMSESKVNQEKASTLVDGYGQLQLALAADQLFLSNLLKEQEATAEEAENYSTSIMDGVEGMIDVDVARIREDATEARNNIRRTKEALRNNRAELAELLDNNKLKGRIEDEVRALEELTGENVADVDEAVEQEAEDLEKDGGNPTRKADGNKKTITLPTGETTRFTSGMASQYGYETDADKNVAINKQFSSSNPGYFYKVDEKNNEVDIIYTDGTEEGNITANVKRKAVDLKDSQGGQHRATLVYLDGELKSIVTRDLDNGSKGNIPMSSVREVTGLEEFGYADIDQVVKSIEDLTLLETDETQSVISDSSIDFQETQDDTLARINLARRSLFESAKTKLTTDVALAENVARQAEVIRDSINKNIPLSRELIEAIYGNKEFDSVIVSDVFNNDKGTILNVIYEDMMGTLKVNDTTGNIEFTDNSGVAHIVAHKLSEYTFQESNIQVLNQTALDLQLDYDTDSKFYLDLYGVKTRPASVVNPVNSITFDIEGNPTGVYLEVMGTGQNILLQNPTIVNEVAQIILAQEEIVDTMMAGVTSNNLSEAVIVQDPNTGVDYAVYKKGERYSIHRKSTSGKFTKPRLSLQTQDRVLGTLREQMMGIADAFVSNAISENSIKDEVRKNGRGVRIPTEGEVFNLPNDSEIEVIESKPKLEVSRNGRKAGQSLEQSIVDEIAEKAVENLDPEKIISEQEEVQPDPKVEPENNPNPENDPLVIPEIQDEYDSDSGYGGVVDSASSLAYSHRETATTTEKESGIRDRFVVRNLEFMAEAMNEGVSDGIFELHIETDYAPFWNEFSEIRDAIRNNTLTKEQLDEFLNKDVPQKLVDKEGKDGKYVKVVDKLPIKISYTNAAGQTFSDGIYMHEAGYNRISVPRKIAFMKDGDAKTAAITAYKDKIKAQSRKNRLTFLRDLMEGTKITVKADSRKPVSKGSPTNSGEQRSLNELLEELGTNANSITLATQSGKDGSVVMPGFKTVKRTSTRGGVYWGHTFTANGERVLTALNKNKLSEEHAWILLSAIEQINSGGKTLNDNFEGEGVTGNVPIKFLLRMLARYGSSTKVSDAVIEESKKNGDDYANNLLKQQLRVDSDGILHFGNNEVNVNDLTDQNRLKFVAWATTEKNYNVSNSMLKDSFPVYITSANKQTGKIKIGSLDIDFKTDSYTGSIIKSGHLNTTAEVVPGTSSITNSPAINLDFSTAEKHDVTSTPIESDEASKFNTYAAYAKEAQARHRKAYEKRTADYKATDYPNLSQETIDGLNNTNKLDNKGVKAFASAVFNGSNMTDSEQNLYNLEANKERIEKELIAMRSSKARKVADKEFNKQYNKLVKLLMTDKWAEVLKSIETQFGKDKMNSVIKQYVKEMSVLQDALKKSGDMTAEQLNSLVENVNAKIKYTEDIIESNKEKKEDDLDLTDPKTKKVYDKIKFDPEFKKAKKLLDQKYPEKGEKYESELEEARISAVRNRLEILDKAERNPDGTLKDKYDPRNITGANKESAGPEVNLEYSTERATKWLKKRFGKGINVTILDKLVKLGSNRHLMGQANVDGITLFHQAAEGTEYHEAFHRASLFYLSDEQRANFYKQAVNQYEELDGKKDSEIEEFLAEKFRAYVTLKNSNRPTTFFGKVGEFFRELWNNIKTIFAGPGRLDNISLKQFYNKIESGRFKYTTLSETDAFLLRGKYANLEIAGEKFEYIQSVQEYQEVLNNLFYMMAAESNLVVDVDGTPEVKFSRLSDVNDLNMESLRIAIEGKIETTTNKIMEGELSEDLEQAYDNTLNMLQEVQEKFEYIKEDFIEYLEDINIEVAEDSDSDTYNENGDEVGEDGDTVAAGDVFGKEAFQYSAADNVANNVKMLLSILPTTSKESRFADLHSFNDFGSMWLDIINSSEAILTAESMMEMLDTKSKGNLAYSTLHKILTDDKALQVQMLNVVKQTKMEFVSAFIEKVEEGITLRFGATSTKAARDNMSRDWAGALKRNESLFIPRKGEVSEPSTDAFLQIVSDYNDLLTFVTDEYEEGSIVNFEEYLDDALDLLNSTGFMVTKEQFRTVINNQDPLNEDKAFYETVERMKYLIGADSDLYKLFTGGDVAEGVNFGTVFSKSGNIQTFMNDVIKANPSVEGLSVLGPGGNLYYTVTQHNALTENIDRMRNDVVGYMEDVLEAEYNKNSVYANYFKENPEAFEKFRLQTLSSITEKNVGDRGREYQKVTDMEEYILRLTANFDNLATLPTPGERKFYQYMTGVPRVSVAVVDGMFTNVEGKGNVTYVDAIDTLVGYYADDVNRAILTRSQVEGVIKEYGQGEDVDALLPQELIENIHYAHNGDKVVKKGEVVLGTVTNEDTGIREWKIIEVGKRAENGDGKLLKKSGVYRGNGAHLNLFKGMEVPTELVTSDNRADVELMVQEILKDRLDEELAKAEQYGIIENTEFGYVPVLVPSNVMEHYVKRTDSTSKAVTNMMADFLVNSMISNVEFTKVFSADPAGFKSDTDVIKRVIGYTATGNSLIADYPQGVWDNERLVRSSTYTTAMLNSYEHKSVLHDSLVEFHSDYYYNNILDSDGNKIYTKAQADAVAKEMLSGMLSNDQTDGQTFITAEMYRALAIKLEEWSTAKEEGYKLLKEEEAGKVLTPAEQVKAAKAVMQPLKMLFMNSNRINGQSYSVFDKMSLATLYRPMYKGTEIEDLIDRMEAKGKYEGMTPIDQLKFTTATKSGKGNTMNYYDNVGAETLADFSYLTPYSQDFSGLRKQLVTDPHDTSEIAVGVQMKKVGTSNVVQNADYKIVGTDEVKKGRDIIREVNDLTSDLSNRGLERTKKRFGLNDNFVITDYKPLIDTLVKDSKTGKLPRFVTKSIKENENGGFYIQPDAQIGAVKWIQSRIISAIKKDTTKINLPGNHFIQVSNIGYHSPTVGTGVTKKKLRWDNGEGYIEAAVSYDFVKHIVPGYENMTFEEAIKKINLDDLPAMAYRVPTQGQNSTFALKVVEILPPNTGHTIIMPAEGPSVAGYDYDIDKLYVVRHNYKNGKKVQYDTNKSIEENSQEAVQNRLLDMYISVWLNEHHKAHRTRPLGYGTDQLIELSDKIVEWTGAERESTTPLKTATPSYQIAVKSRLKFSGAGIGPSALANTFLMLSQSVDIGLNVNLGYSTTSTVDGNTMTSFAPLVGLDNQYKTEWFSALLDGFIDAGSNPFIYDLNANDYTLPTATLLLMSGVGGIKTFSFLAQPILKEIAQSQENKDNAVGLDLRGVINDIEDSYMSKYEELAGDKYVPETLKSTYSTIMFDVEGSFKKSFQDLGELNKGNEVGADYYKHQLDVLRAFKYLQNYSGSLKDAILAARADSGKFGSTVGEVTQFQVRVDKAVVNSTRANGIRNFDKAMTDTFLGTLTSNSVGSIQNILGQIILEGTPGFVELRDRIIASTGFKYSAGNALVEAIAGELNVNIAANFFVDVLGVDNSTVSELLYGDNSLASRLYDVRTGKNGSELASNPLIEALIPYSEQDRPHFLSFRKPDTKFMKDSYNMAWSDILTNHGDFGRKLGMDMFKYAYITSGFKTGVFSFFDVVPRDVLLDTGFNEYIKQTMDKSISDPLVFTNMFEEVFENAWNNDRLVPVYRRFDKDAKYPTSGQGTVVTFPVNSDLLTVGEDSRGNVYGKPYIKNIKGEDSKLYKNIGYSSATKELIYREVPKKSYYNKGFVIRENMFENGNIPQNGEVKFSNKTSEELLRYTDDKGRRAFPELYDAEIFTSHAITRSYDAYDGAFKGDTEVTDSISTEEGLGDSTFETAPNNLNEFGLSEEIINEIENEVASFTEGEQSRIVELADSSLEDGLYSLPSDGTVISINNVDGSFYAITKMIGHTSTANETNETKETC